MVKESDELEFLNYFFDQANLSIQDRIFLEEGYEFIFNKTVPDKYKMDISHLMRMSKLPTKKVDAQTVPAIPKQPKLPEFEISETQCIDLDKYELIHKGSGEHASLSLIIRKLKEMV